jgi:hypothetical protein
MKNFYALWITNKNHLPCYLPEIPLGELPRVALYTLNKCAIDVPLRQLKNERNAGKILTGVRWKEAGLKTSRRKQREVDNITCGAPLHLVVSQLLHPQVIVGNFNLFPPRKGSSPKTQNISTISSTVSKLYLGALA